MDNNIRSGEMYRFQLTAFPRCTLHNDIAKLTSDGYRFSTDLVFVVGKEEVEVESHIAIVASRSPWLRARIREAIAKASEAENSSENVLVHLPEADPTAFRLVLEYIYSDKIDPTMRSGKRSGDTSASNEVIMQVYTLSVAFKMAKLEKLCVRYLESSVSLKNVLTSLQNASRLKLQPIKEYCLRFIIKESNYNMVINSSEFETLDQPLMVEIIRRRQAKPEQSSSGVSLSASLSVSKDFAASYKKECLADDLRDFLFNSGKEFADVTLVLDGNNEYPAHKAILAARSSYFEGMFRSFSPTSNRIDVLIGEMIPSRQSFQSLLRYIYYGDTTMPPEDSLYLFTAPSFYIFTNNRLQVKKTKSKSIEL